MPWRGLEPRRLAAPPPQDGVSTNFTTRALTALSCGVATAVRTTGLTGLEPATSGVTDRHSNQLSYSPLFALSCTALSCTALRALPCVHCPACTALPTVLSERAPGVRRLNAPGFLQ